MADESTKLIPEDKPPVPSELPEPVIPYAWLLGTWVGVGLGQYPTIDDFRFGQELRFWTDGRPFLYFQSLSWVLDEDGEKVSQGASESGFWRPKEDSLEAVMTYSSGYTEFMVGTNEVTQIQDAVITAANLKLKTDVIVSTPTAKEYTASERLFGLNGGDLFWTYDMAAVGQPLQNHLSAQLKRASFIGDPQLFQAS